LLGCRLRHDAGGRRIPATAKMERDTEFEVFTARHGNEPQHPMYRGPLFDYNQMQCLKSRAAAPTTIIIKRNCEKVH